MKYCRGCGAEVEDNVVICPEKCGVGFEPTRPPKALSKDDLATVGAVVWNRLWRKHLLFIFGEFSVLMVVGVVSLLLAYVGAVGQLKTELVKRVGKEVEKPEIQAAVREGVKDYATDLLGREVQPSIDAFKKELRAKMDQLTEAVEKFKKDSEGNVAEVRETTRFALLVAKALSDDRKALDGLREIRDGTNYPFNAMAGDAVINVNARAGIERFETMRLQAIEAPIENPDTASVQEYADAAVKPSTPMDRIFLYRRFNGQGRFPLEVRLKFLREALEHEISVRASEEIVRLMDEHAKLRVNVSEWRDLCSLA